MHYIGLPKPHLWDFTGYIVVVVIGKRLPDPNSTKNCNAANCES